VPGIRFLDICFLFLSLLPMLPPTLSLQLPMKFGNVVQVETSRYLTKIATLRRRPIANSFRFLQPSIRLRYNYYVQLVATKRGRMRVPNLKFWSARQRGGGKLVVYIVVTVSSTAQSNFESIAKIKIKRASHTRTTDL